MELRQLRYFIAVAEEGNFAAAALRVNVTQPPVSRQIHALEEELGIQLLRRGSRGTTLTEGGRVFLSEARKIIDTAMRARERSIAADRGEIGKLIIGYFGSCIYRTVPSLLTRFKERVPDAHISFARVPKSQQIEALRSGAIDVGFSRYLLGAPDVTVETVAKERLYVALRREDPLAEKPSVQFSDLAGRSLVLFPRGGRPSFADAVLGHFSGDALTPSAVIDAEDSTSAIASVAVSGGICVVPESVITIQMPRVVYRLIDNTSLLCPTSCAFLTTTDAPLPMAFIEFIRHALEKERGEVSA